MLSKLKGAVRTVLDRTPLWAEIAVIMALLTSGVTFLLVYKDYTSIRQNALQNRVSVTTHLLNLETGELEQYLADLGDFSVLPCYDSRFSLLCQQRAPFSSGDEDYIKEQMFSYYYTRRDIRNFTIYFLNQGVNIGRTLTEQHMTARPTVLDTAPIYAGCEASPYNYMLAPAVDDSSFFTYYHSLIRIKNQDPQAIVMLEVDSSYLNRLLANHSDAGEILAFLDASGHLIYSSDTALLANEQLPALYASEHTRDGCTTVSLGGAEYLFTSCTGTKYGTSLLSLIPVSSITTQIDAISFSVIRSGVLIGLCTILALSVLSRLVLKPLNILTRKMEQAGSGDFHATIDRGGSREIVELSHSFNSMLRHIDELIKRTYMAELSEKNARLTALEAQLNPHFLYNTLQAISTEALINDQPKIHKMVTSLATNLHYTIKGADLVPLKRELQYVSDYIFLQKVRMDENLTVKQELDPAAEGFLVPKISIQTLVENSILHGARPDSAAICIHIKTSLEAGRLRITVTDNGHGIPDEQLQNLYREFRERLTSGHEGGIGLSNLYVRLHLLYEAPAEILIDTKPNEYTSITLDLPAVAAGEGGRLCTNP
jgi:two-component system sensor histidine kinase YesM